MKNMIKLPAMILGLFLLFAGTAQKAMAQDEDISLETFYDELAPFGTWFQDPQYGYVWRPDVDQSNFRPYYTDGRWAMTEYGNTWVSDYEWGWAPFHYGRWVLNQYHEWIWIPDTVWGPAWVSWRSGGGYYGWAPLSPGFDISIGFGGGYSIPNDWWVFIPQINIYSSNYPRYYNRGNSFFNRTSYINYTYGGRGRNNYYTGPRAGDIRRVTNRDVTIYNINRSNRPGRTSISNNNLNIYNPRGGGRPNNAGRPGNNNGPGNNGQGNGRPGQPDRNNGGSNGRPGNAGRPGNNDNGGNRPGQPDRNNGVPNSRPGNNGRPTGNESGNTAPGQPARPTQGRDNNMQRPPENRRDGQDRIQNMQRDNQQDQQRQQREGQQRQDQQQRQQQDQQRQQREGQQRQEQQQRQQQDQQRQQREGQQRQEQQQRQQQDQQRQQREGQQRQEQQQRQQQRQQQPPQQQQQARPARTEGQTTPPANTESSRRSRGGERS